MTLVQQYINEDVLENGTMTTEIPEEAPTTPTVREAEAEAEAEAEVKVISITPPAPPVLSRYISKSSNLIAHNKKAFEL